MNPTLRRLAEALAFNRRRLVLGVHNGADLDDVAEAQAWLAEIWAAFETAPREWMHRSFEDVAHSMIETITASALGEVEPRDAANAHAVHCWAIAGIGNGETDAAFAAAGEPH
jgi:hypothetical protein